MEKVTIKELNADNWYECCELKISEEQQKFIVPNAVSIAQSKFEPTLKTFAIYLGDSIKGFVMYNTVKEELESYWIYRIMVDREFQGRGIAEKATRLIIEEISKLEDCSRITVGYVAENTRAHNLYSKLGFKDRGDRFGREMAVVLEVKGK